jgi:flavin reductase (DIM6/NTAB) family NADH-FMN oxidoreductase RutF
VYGTTITSFTPVNADPPVVLVSLGPNAQVLPFLQTGSRFTINLLEESQSRWAEVFADPYPVGASPFAESGDPILDGAMVWLTCRVEAVVDAGRGARLVLGAVLDGDAGAGLRPLLWHRRGPTRLPPDR